jgi:hypothetical protein
MGPDACITADFDIAGLLECSMNGSNTFGAQEGDITDPIADVSESVPRRLGDSRAGRKVPPIAS